MDYDEEPNEPEPTRRQAYDAICVAAGKTRRAFTDADMADKPRLMRALALLDQAAGEVFNR